MLRTPACRLALTALLIAASACATDDGVALSQRIDDAMEAVIADGTVAGAAVAVVRGEEILHARGYGLADRERQTPASETTYFNLGSVTKILTGAALVRLAGGGALSLDDSLGTWLPEFPNPGQGASITLRHLVNHTSGLSDYVAADIARYEVTGTTMPADLVFEFLRDRPLDFEPGTHWSYTNTGFFLAGLVIARASGQPWADYVAEQVLAPLGLPGIRLCDDVRDVAAAGYERGDAGLAPHPLYLVPGLRGDGGMCATALDLARLPGRLAAGSALTPQGFELMHAATLLESGARVDYGLGARRGHIQGRPLWGHTGGHAGTIAAVAHFPDDAITLVVMINTIRSGRDALALLGDVAAPVLGLDMSMPAQVPLEAAALARYAGRFAGGREGGHYEIRADAGQLRIRWSEGDTEAAYVHVGDQTFVREGGAYPLDRYVFQDVDGRIIALSDYYNGLHGHFRQREELVHRPGGPNAPPVPGR